MYISIDHFGNRDMRRLPSIEPQVSSRAERIWETDHSNLSNKCSLILTKEDRVYPYQPLHTNTRGGQCGLKMKVRVSHH